MGRDWPDGASMIPGIVAGQMRSSIAPTQPPPTVIGTAYGGGFFVGDVTLPDGVYAVIMAGLGGQSPATLQWKNANTFTGGTGGLVDGRANTLAMQTGGLDAHPAGAYCLGYSGAGFGDWYLPSRDELNLAWVNRASLAALAMAPDFYHSSTQSSSDFQMSSIQNFDTGTQNFFSFKTNALQVRPARRVKRS